MRAPVLSSAPSLIGAMLLLAACSKGPDPGVQPASSALLAPAASAASTSGAAVPSALVSAAPVGSAVDGTGSDLASIFAGAPDDPARTTRAIKHAGKFSGAVIAVAEGWAANDYEDDSDLIVWGPSLGHTGRDEGELYVIAEKVAKPGTEPDDFTGSNRAAVVYIAGGRKVVWGAPWFGPRGAEGVKVKVWRGEGQGLTAKEGKRGVYAFSTWAADKRVQGAGSWALSRPEDEKAIIQMIKSLKG
jgi:hypothetical protein